ncbi:MAG: cytochrome c oxidase subunit II [Phycisphaerae bacterium]
MKSRALVPVVTALTLLALGTGIESAFAQDALTDGAAAATEGPQIDGDYGTWWLPPNISKTAAAKGVDDLINFLHAFMLILFVGWGIFFLYCLVKFRQRPGHTAAYAPVKAKPAKYAEIIVAGIEAVLLLGFSVPIWANVKNNIPTEDQHPLHIRVIGEQFQWNFHYAGPDGKFGRTRPEFINGATNVLGLDPDDPAAADDIYAAELHFPVNRPVICSVSSKDVIHSFSLPVLRVKQDAIPGMRIPVWFEAGRSGNYEVACAQLCGNNHYSMRALMAVHDSQESFDAWLESQQAEEFDEDDFD